MKINVTLRRIAWSNCSEPPAASSTVVDVQPGATEMVLAPVRVALPGVGPSDAVEVVISQMVHKTDDDVGQRMRWLQDLESAPEREHERPSRPEPVTEVTVDWAHPTDGAVRTSSQIEVDFMPFLSRSDDGGSFDGYFNALSNLGAEYMRFSPWVGYPKVVVPELEESSCPGSNWNSTLMDQAMSDFMAGVCGMDAGEGRCEHSVAQQLSTMPVWLYKDGKPTEPLPADPWVFPSGDMNFYSQPAHSARLKDPTCGQMARYAARFVGWYTASGFTDECGHYHHSGLRYNWEFLSVLNENEHEMVPSTQYTTCFDRWREEISKVNPNIKLIGPEGISSLACCDSSGQFGPLTKDRHDFIYDFLNPANHKNGEPPAVLSFHVSVGMKGQKASMFGGFDAWFDAFALPLQSTRDKLSPTTQLAMNEYITEVWEWCATSSGEAAAAAAGGACPDASFSNTSNMTINRATLQWSLAAAAYAYGFGRLSELGYLYVTADQLVAGPWPDNCPFVASLDWQSGEPNAKFWIVRMLAAALGKRERTLMPTVVSNNATAYALGMQMAGTEQRVLLLVSKTSELQTFDVGFAKGWRGAVLEGVGAEPGFVPPRATTVAAGSVRVGPYGIALLWSTEPRDPQIKTDDAILRPDEVAAAPARRNILYMISDDMRPEWDVYCPTCGLQTPHLNKLASEGLLFTRAYCEEAFCASSRNSFMTGRRSGTTLSWNFVETFVSEAFFRLRVSIANPAIALPFSDRARCAPAHLAAVPPGGVYHSTSRRLPTT